jgi:hypothetical protein
MKYYVLITYFDKGSMDYNDSSRSFLSVKTTIDLWWLLFESGINIFRNTNHFNLLKILLFYVWVYIIWYFLPSRIQEKLKSRRKLIS